MDENQKALSPECVDAVLCCATQGSFILLRKLLKMLYLEGRSFAKTDESVCYQLWLRDLEPFKAASILWAISNMDGFVLNAPEPKKSLDDMLSF